MCSEGISLTDYLKIMVSSIKNPTDIQTNVHRIIYSELTCVFY